MTQPATPILPPLKIRCTASDCDRNLHCFRTTKKLREANQAGRCRSCGVDLIDWTRVHQRDLADVDFTFGSLRHELVRHYFWHVTLDERAVNYARRKGRKRLAEAVEQRLRQSVGPAVPVRDGRQTPREGSGIPTHYAQHATASCCRACIEEWHAIPRGRPLTEDEILYLTGLAMRYLEERLSLTDEGEFVPPIRQPRG